MGLYQLLFNSVLTRLDAERVHHMAMRMLELGSTRPIRNGIGYLSQADTDGMRIDALGLHFDHPLGLATGLDKDAVCVPALQASGFSFAELGSITPRPQPGNEGKRIWRLIEDRALINRMGFPSKGMDAAAKRLVKLPPMHMIKGISLGKNKATPLETAHEDYCAVLKKLDPYADFFVINVSSPNTAGLKDLQTDEFLSTLLANVKQCNVDLTQNGKIKPLLIKVAPDLAYDQLDYLLEMALSHGLDGIVATNTHPTHREGLISRHKDQTGGLSGAPIRTTSSQMIRYIRRHTEGKLTIIGVGGVFSGADVWDKLAAGATLVQAYTGYIYEGPFFAKNVLSQLRQKMLQEGVKSFNEVIGSG